MNLNLTPDQVAEVKTNFTAWDEIGDRASELKAEVKAVLERAAVIYECKPAMVSKLFKNMKKKMDNGQDEINEIALMEEVIRNNGE
jgi:hypothetical protein